MKQKQIFDRLEDNRLLAQLFFQNSSDAILIFNLDKKCFIDVNDQAVKMIGKKKKDLLKISLKELFPPEKADDFIFKINECFKGSNGFLENLVLVDKNNKEIPVNLAAGEMTLSDKRIRSFAFQNLIEQKQLQIQLSHAQKMQSVGELAAGIAHEINTPMQFIGDNIDFLKNTFNDLIKILDEGQELIQLLKQGTHYGKLLENLEVLIQERDLDYLKKESPIAINQALIGVNQVIHIVQAMKAFIYPNAQEMKSIDINGAIESVITVSKNEWKYVADLETNFDPNLPPVLCFGNEVNQTILNILVNAAHAVGEKLKFRSYDKGEITISTRRKGKWAEIRIRDTGVGIPDNIKAKIFDPFFTTKDAGKGTGQGLYLVHGFIVKHHHGNIDVETEPGKGTTFIISIPLQPTEKITNENK